jgi:hypothetical protein
MRRPAFATLLLLGSAGLSHCGDDPLFTDTFASSGVGGDEGGAGETGESGDGNPGGGRAGAGGDGPAACPADSGELANAFASVVCAKRAECCRDDTADCLAEVSRAMDEIYVELAQSVQSGTASLACARFDACARAIADASCGDWPLQSGSLAEIPVDEPACRELVTPLLRDGEACRWNYECDHGFCYAEDGLCHAYAAENEPCTDTLCELPTAFCNAAGLCQRRLENGVSCADHSECQSGRCDADGTGSCVAPGPDACRYVPAAPASCAVSSAPGRSRRDAVLFWLGLVVVTCLRAARRQET